MTIQVQEESYRPEIIYPSSSTAKTRLNELHSETGVMVFDSIEMQVSEWIKTMHPDKKFHPDELREKVVFLLGNNPDLYGCWVYYPWSKRLVHTLPAMDFIKVRTSRNQYKITPEEQAVLHHKRIGVVGLSVGQSVSVTIAMERIGGELRLADFDMLELTNLNRIRTGIHNLGIPKVVSVAREIAEIDPFIKVVVFEQGLTEANMESFFFEGGKLDLLIEESDGFDIKILSRLKAREWGVPVLMEASDRCMVDVERFDLEPGRPVLHGLVDHLNIETLRGLKTTEEKIPYMLDILGIETASLRLKASMLEIEQSINTWPQLASAVTMGGGIAADVGRRMLLGQFQRSGRFYVDIDALIGDELPQDDSSLTRNQVKPIQTWSFSKSVLVGLPTGDSPGPEKDLMIKWIEHACLAPSAGNNQPWAFAVGKSLIYVFYDDSRCLRWTDPTGRLARLALGASVENIVLSAGMDGYSAKPEFLSYSETNQPVAVIAFDKSDAMRFTSVERGMAQAIPLRCSNRKKAMAGELEDEIKQVVEQILDSGYALRYAGGETGLHELAELVSEVEQIRFMHPEGHDEFFKHEIRWTDQQAQTSRDGLDIKSLELNNLESTGVKVAAVPEVMALLRKWKGGKGLGKATREAIKGSDALVLLKGPGQSEMQDGRMLQRAWLLFTSLGRSFHPVSAPVFFFDRKHDERSFNAEERAKLELLEKRFLSFFPEEKGLKNIFLFRVAKSEPPVVRSLRRPPMIEFIEPPYTDV